ncbi:hypothetical protein PIB30_065891 [Stylosanthes scabra]|uniref:Uncharacterized protein n=1 Tax=Stylosanthes scabra TaxID=79078 RepID=A0ABU6XN24_9FABA|nr:hypothetical protein [Stylosanthes scabra]
MASQASQSLRGSRSTRRFGIAKGKTLLCWHRVTPILVSGTKENPRRRFWGCVYYEVGWPNVTSQGAREGQQASPTVTFGPRFQTRPNVTHSLTKLSKPTKVTFQSLLASPKRESNVTPQQAPKLKPSLSKGHKDKQILEFDPEIEQTLRKLRKQAKLQKQPHEISSKEVFEEGSVNMAKEGDQRKTLGEFTVPTTASCAVA